jgi:hypothetical protein
VTVQANFITDIEAAGQCVVVGSKTVVLPAFSGDRNLAETIRNDVESDIQAAGSRLTAEAHRGRTTRLFVDAGVNRWLPPCTVTNRAVHDDDRPGTPLGRGLTTFGRGTPTCRSRRWRRGNPPAIGQQNVDAGPLSGPGSCPNHPNRRGIKLPLFRTHSTQQKDTRHDRDQA